MTILLILEDPFYGLALNTTKKFNTRHEAYKYLNTIEFRFSEDTVYYTHTYEDGSINDSFTDYIMKNINAADKYIITFYDSLGKIDANSILFTCTENWAHSYVAKYYEMPSKKGYYVAGKQFAGYKVNQI